MIQGIHSEGRKSAYNYFSSYQFAAGSADNNCGGAAYHGGMASVGLRAFKSCSRA